MIESKLNVEAISFSMYKIKKSVKKEKDYVSSKYGLENDILLFGHMVAQVILKSLGQNNLGYHVLKV